MKFRLSSLILGVLALALTASMSAAQTGTPAAAPAKPAAPAAKSTTTVTTATAPNGTMSTTTNTKMTTKTHAVAAKARVDINTAAKEDLTKLPGITEDIADKIIAGRPYKTKTDLVKNKTLTSAQYSKVRMMIIAKQAAAAK